MSDARPAPVTAAVDLTKTGGFDANGDWHDNYGRFAKKGWTAAKYAALALLRGALAAEAARTRPDGVDLSVRPDSPLRRRYGPDRRRVRWHSSTHGIVDGPTGRPTLVRWAEFTDPTPDTNDLPDRKDIADATRGPTGGSRPRSTGVLDATETGIDTAANVAEPLRSDPSHAAYLDAYLNGDIFDQRWAAARPRSKLYRHDIVRAIHESYTGFVDESASTRGFHRLVASAFGRADHLGMVDAVPGSDPNGDIAAAMSHFKGIGADAKLWDDAKFPPVRRSAVEQMLRDLHAHTQAYLAGLGYQPDDRVVVWRGLSGPQYREWVAAGRPDHLNSTPFAAFAHAHDRAQRYGEREAGGVVAVEVRVGDILSVGLPNHDYETLVLAPTDTEGFHVVSYEEPGLNGFYNQWPTREAFLADNPKPDGSTWVWGDRYRNDPELVAVRSAAPGVASAITWAAHHGRWGGTVLTIPDLPDDADKSTVARAVAERVADAVYPRPTPDIPTADRNDLADPTVTLDDAIDWWAGEVSMEITGEAAALLGLTTEDGWTPERNSSPELAEAARVLVDAVNTSPVSPDPLYHGRGNLQTPPKVGDRFPVALMATTPDITQAHGWRTSMGEDPPGWGIVYRFENTPGLPITPGNGERLVSGQFTVAGVDTADDGAPVVTLRYDGPLTPAATPDRNDLAVAPGRTLADYTTPGVVAWAGKIAEGTRSSSAERLRQAVEDWNDDPTPMAARALWAEVTGDIDSRRWIEQTLTSPSPDPDAVETLRQAHLAAVDELGAGPTEFFRRGVASGPFDAGETGLWIREGDELGVDSRVRSWTKPGPFTMRSQYVAPAPETGYWAAFDVTQVLANIGDMQDNGEYLIAESPAIIDRLMAGQFPIVPQPDRNNLPPRLTFDESRAARARWTRVIGPMEQYGSGEDSDLADATQAAATAAIDPADAAKIGAVVFDLPPKIRAAWGVTDAPPDQRFPNGKLPDGTEFYLDYGDTTVLPIRTPTLEATTGWKLLQRARDLAAAGGREPVTDRAEAVLLDEAQTELDEQLASRAAWKASLPDAAKITTVDQYLAAVGRNVVRQMFAGWNEQSLNIGSVAGQRAVADEFGLDPTPDQRVAADVQADADRLYAAAPQAWRSYVRAVYNATQDRLAAEGVTDATVFRGTNGDTPDAPDAPLSSWSVSPNIAAAFGRNIRRADRVPAADIFATPLTAGIGKSEEGELVLLNRPRVTVDARPGWPHTWTPGTPDGRMFDMWFDYDQDDVAYPKVTRTVGYADTNDLAVAPTGPTGTDRDLSFAADTTLPWQYRVERLAAERDLIAARLGPPEHWFRSAAPDTLARIWAADRDGKELDPDLAEPLARIEQIEQYGQALATLVAERATELGGDRPPRLYTDEAATAILDALDEFSPGATGPIAPDVDATMGGWSGPGGNRDGLSDPLEAWPGIIDGIRDGTTEVLIKANEVVLYGTHNGKTVRVTINRRNYGGDFAGGRTVTLPSGRRKYVRDGYGHVNVEVSTPGARFTRSTWRRGNGDFDTFKKTVKAAVDKSKKESHDDLTNPPTLRAWTETMEAMGVDMSTDPDVLTSDGKAPTTTVTVEAWGEQVEVTRDRDYSAVPGLPKTPFGKLKASTAAAKTFKVGLAPWPRSWTRLLPPQHLDISTATGTNAGSAYNVTLDEGGNYVRTASVVGAPQHASSVAHEFGHSMQKAVPGVHLAEMWHMIRRLRAHPDTQADSRLGDTRFADHFADPYTGRVYPADGDRDSWMTAYGADVIPAVRSFEIITTGVQALYTTAKQKRQLGDDPELTGLTLGLMSLIRDPDQPIAVMPDRPEPAAADTNDLPARPVPADHTAWEADYRKGWAAGRRKKTPRMPDGYHAPTRRGAKAAYLAGIADARRATRDQERVRPNLAPQRRTPELDYAQHVVDGLAARYPIVRDLTVRSASMREAHGRTTTGYGIIQLDRDVLNGRRADLGNGSPESRSIDGVVTHEFGHALQDAIELEPFGPAFVLTAIAVGLDLPVDVITRWDDPRIAQRLETQLGSKYAAASAQEAFAEAFTVASRRTGDLPPLAREIRDLTAAYARPFERPDTNDLMVRPDATPADYTDPTGGPDPTRFLYRAGDRITNLALIPPGVRFTLDDGRTVTRNYRGAVDDTGTQLSARYLLGLDTVDGRMIPAEDRTVRWFALNDDIADPTPTAPEWWLHLGPDPAESFDYETWRALNESDPDAASDMFEESQAVARQWKANVVRAISLNLLTPEAADTLYQPGGVGGYTRPRWWANQLASHYGGAAVDDTGEAWRPLPDRLYHATANVAAVETVGRLLSRAEIPTPAGLGGGSDDTVSFTADRDTAVAIVEALHEAADVAAGRVTVADLIEQARRGDGAPRPFLDDFLRYWKTTSTDPLPPALTRAMPGGDNDTPDGRFEVYKTFAAYRQAVGGKLDPLFFAANPHNIAAIDHDNVGIIEVVPAVDGARGIQLGSLGEWRTAVSDATRIDRVERIPDPDTNNLPGRTRSTVTTFTPPAGRLTGPKVAAMAVSGEPLWHHTVPAADAQQAALLRVQKVLDMAGPDDIDPDGDGSLNVAAWREARGYKLDRSEREMLAVARRDPAAIARLFMRFRRRYEGTSREPGWRDIGPFTVDLPPEVRGYVDNNWEAARTNPMVAAALERLGVDPPMMLVGRYSGVNSNRDVSGSYQGGVVFINAAPSWAPSAPESTLAVGPRREAAIGQSSVGGVDPRFTPIHEIGHYVHDRLAMRSGATEGVYVGDPDADEWKRLWTAYHDRYAADFAGPTGPDAWLAATTEIDDAAARRRAINDRQVSYYSHENFKEGFAETFTLVASGADPSGLTPEGRALYDWMAVNVFGIRPDQTAADLDVGAVFTVNGTKIRKTASGYVDDATGQPIRADGTPL